MEENAVVVTSDMLDGIISVVTDNLAVILPAGITLLGVMIGVTIIPRLVYKFL